MRTKLTNDQIEREKGANCFDFMFEKEEKVITKCRKKTKDTHDCVESIGGKKRDDSFIFLQVSRHIALHS